MNFGILISPFPGNPHLIFCPLIYKFFFCASPPQGGGGLWDHNFLAFMRFCVRSSEWYFHFWHCRWWLHFLSDWCQFFFTCSAILCTASFQTQAAAYWKNFMAGSGLTSLGRVKLTDLVPYEGLPSDSYKLSVSTLS